MAPEETSRPAQEIDQLLAALESSRRELEETWAGMEQTGATLVPQAEPAPLPEALATAPTPAPFAESLREQARGEGYEARRRVLRKLFLRLRDERQRLDEVRRDLRGWTEQLSVRFGALAKAETEFAARRNSFEEDRLRRQEESLRDERRRFEEDRIRFERERLDEERRRGAYPPAAYAPPPPAYAPPPAAPPAAPAPSFAKAPAPPAPAAPAPAPVSRPLGSLSPASDDSPPPQWGATINKEM